MAKLAPADDLQDITSRLGLDWELLRGQRILLTGATGFFGKWLTQALLHVDREFKLGLRLTVVSRDQKRAEADSPWLAGRVEWAEGDIRTVSPRGEFPIIIHGAAAASRDLNENQPTVMFDTVLEGTRHMLDVARDGGCKLFMFISSGAVYGAQTDSHVAETALTAPDPLDPRAAYGEAKRAAEFLCASYSRAAGFELKIARCFAFIGPYLPIDLHFAAGNFIGQVLKNQPIAIGGDGTPLRSYLYASDLVVWLLTILLRGESHRAYNVGSDHSVSIAQLARAVHQVGLETVHQRAELHQPITIAKTAAPGQAVEKYVPSTGRAQKELALSERIDLTSAIRKTTLWHLNDSI